MVRQLYRPGETDPSVFVYAYLGLGDKDAAFVWLEKAYAQHSNSITTLKVDPIYDPLRGDPRLQDLLRRVGLAEQSSDFRRTGLRKKSIEPNWKKPYRALTSARAYVALDQITAKIILDQKISDFALFFAEHRPEQR
jgi:hypothetical protein